MNSMPCDCLLRLGRGLARGHGTDHVLALQTIPLGHGLQIYWRPAERPRPTPPPLVVSLGNLSLPQEQQARWPAWSNNVCAAKPNCPGQCSGSVLGLADTIAKRVEREGRWRSAPQPPGPGPKPAEGWSWMACWPIGSPTLMPRRWAYVVAWQAWQRLGLPAVLEVWA